ncbi:hypothetical protein ACLIMP_09660 [Novosphingobium aerophilum]|uniref:hypothetical protein n=1 Tax=Novosphingobium TaxID=165696 RepID=UPI0006C8AA61|nr:MULTISPECIES: hypothetical protein [unclassified Novosphingobium]KPH58686.1 hypothetical protein ADT71_25410 [Novosphingobium sp. ST904]MPS70587.1 hypothetical protein [Novosphingobium sp.]TCM42150.1 hypothetical protein EDF59_102112 [Novosphingobium sp. ST904]WRT91420.1 hypothetical protein U9J33_09265 [Novosphingobium sp. RL4]
MKKFVALAAAASVASFAIVPAAFAETTQSVRAVTEEAAAPVDLTAGKMLYAANGYRLAPIYRVAADGNPQVILNGRLVTVPASSLANVDGKLTTSLSKKDIASAK